MKVLVGTVNGVIASWAEELQRSEFADFVQPFSDFYVAMDIQTIDALKRLCDIIKEPLIISSAINLYGNSLPREFDLCITIYNGYLE